MTQSDHMVHIHTYEAYDNNIKYDDLDVFFFPLHLIWKYDCLNLPFVVFFSF